MEHREHDLKCFRRFVADTNWRFAKTYVESYPHEYTLQRCVDPDTFSTAIRSIEQWGVVESFWRAERKYLYVDERKYWHMGKVGSENVGEHPTLINRTWVDVSRYRENAKSCGYDDSAVDLLAERWVTLLQRAKCGS